MIRGLFLVELRSAAVFQAILGATLLLGAWILQRILALQGIGGDDAVTGVDVTIAVLLVAVAFSAGARVNGVDRQARHAFLARLPLPRVTVWAITVTAEFLSALTLIVVVVAVRPGVGTIAGVVEPTFVALAAMLWAVLFAAGVLWSHVLLRPLLCHIIGVPLSLGAFALATAPRALVDSWYATAVAFDPEPRRYVPATVVLMAVQTVLSLWMHVRRDPGRSLPVLRDAATAGVIPLVALAMFLAGIADRVVGWDYPGVTTGGRVFPTADGTRVAVEEKLRDLSILRRVRVIDTGNGKTIAIHPLPFGVALHRFRWTADGRVGEFVSHDAFGIIDLERGVHASRIEGWFQDATPRSEDWLLSRALDPSWHLLAADPATGALAEVLRLSKPRPGAVVFLDHVESPVSDSTVVVAVEARTYRVLDAWVVRGRDAEPLELADVGAERLRYVWRERGYADLDTLVAEVSGQSVPEVPSTAHVGPSGGRIARVPDPGHGLYRVAATNRDSAEVALQGWAGERDGWVDVHPRVVLGAPEDETYAVFGRRFWSRIEPVGGAMLYACRAEEDRIEVALFDPATGWNVVLGPSRPAVRDGAGNAAKFLGNSVVVRERAGDPILVQVDLREPDGWESSSSAVYLVDPHARRVIRFARTFPTSSYVVSGVHDGRVLLVATSRPVASAGLYVWLDPDS